MLSALRSSSSSPEGSLPVSSDRSPQGRRRLPNGPRRTRKVGGLHLKGPGSNINPEMKRGCVRHRRKTLFFPQHRSRSKQLQRMWNHKIPTFPPESGNTSAGPPKLQLLLLRWVSLCLGSWTQQHTNTHTHTQPRSWCVLVCSLGSMRMNRSSQTVCQEKKHTKNKVKLFLKYKHEDEMSLFRM